MSGFEQQFLGQRDLRNVESLVDIQAAPAVVGKNVERVPRIDQAQLQPSWSHAIGFPNPEEATLSPEGIGGVRHASFEGGVLFIETVDVREPERRLGFPFGRRPSRFRPPPWMNTSPWEGSSLMCCVENTHWALCTTEAPACIW
jgi:hypothetical protein